MIYESENELGQTSYDTVVKVGLKLMFQIQYTNCYLLEWIQKNQIFHRVDSITKCILLAFQKIDNKNTQQKLFWKQKFKKLKNKNKVIIIITRDKWQDCKKKGQ